MSRGTLLDAYMNRQSKFVCLCAALACLIALCLKSTRFTFVTLCCRVCSFALFKGLNFVVAKMFTWISDNDTRIVWGSIGTMLGLVAAPCLLVLPELLDIKLGFASFGTGYGVLQLIA